MKTLLLSFLAIASLTAPASAKDYQVSSLDNGMRIVLREDHSAPLVAVVVCVKAGAAYENILTSGSAHFLEHLLFDGTLTRSREDIQHEFESRGGYFNAFTRKEFTAFEIVMPSEYVRSGIAVQADMLLNSIISDEELSKERQVVIEEMKKDKDNPYSYAQQLFAGAFYRSTPYERPVIGFENTIRRMKRSELYDYYQRYYHPSNMTAIVIGDFDSTEVTQWLEESYGSFLARPFPEPCEPEELSFERTTKVIHYAETRTPFVTIGFPAPTLDDSLAPAFEILTYLLSSRNNSLLDQALTEGRPPLAAFVTGEYDLFRCTAGYTVTLMPLMESQIDACVDAVTREIDKLAREPLKKEELDRALFDYKAQELFTEEKFLHEARDIAYWEAVASVGERQTFKKNLGKVTPDKVMEACRIFLAEKNHLVSVLLPGRKPIARTETEQPQAEIRMRTLQNGLRLIVKETPRTGISAVNIIVGSRSALEPPDKQGIGNFVSMMLESGTKDLSAGEIAESLAAMGAKLKLVDNPDLPFDDYYESQDYSYVRMEVLSENLPRALFFLSNLVFEPAFPGGEMEKARARILKLISKREDSTYRTARDLFFDTLFPQDPYSRRILGEETSVKSITREDLEDYHSRTYAPGNLVVCVVTDRPVEEILECSEKVFSKFPAVELPRIKPSSYIRPSSPRVARKQLQKEQVYIYLGFGLPGIASEDVPALEIMAAIVSTRLKQQLREKQGLAYRVGAALDFHRDVGWFVASIGTRPENTKTAVKGILDQLERIRLELPSEDELEVEKNSYWGHLLRYHQRKINQAYYLSLYEYLGVGYQYDLTHLDALRNVTPADVKRVAERYVTTEGYVLAMSGPLEE